jgi:hypothetical protein
VLVRSISGKRGCRYKSIGGTRFQNQGINKRLTDRLNATQPVDDYFQGTKSGQTHLSKM